MKEKSIAGHIMVKKTERRKSRSLLALISVLSIIVAFVAVCYFVLSVLHKAGVYQLPEFMRPVQTTEVTQPVEYKQDVPVTYSYGYTMSIVSEIDYVEFLKHSPYADSFFMKATLYNYNQNTASFSDFEYWIWKNGSKYKISVRDPSTSTLIKVVICNGERVMVSDEINGIVEYHDAKDYTLLNQTPFPDFTEYFSTGYEIAYFGENEDELFITLNHLEEGDVLNLLFNKNQGIVTGYEVFKDNVMISDYVLDTFEKLGYTTDSMFNFD